MPARRVTWMRVDGTRHEMIFRSGPREALIQDASSGGKTPVRLCADPLRLAAEFAWAKIAVGCAVNVEVLDS